jgi:cell division protein FtsW
MSNSTRSPSPTRSSPRTQSQASPSKSQAFVARLNLGTFLRSESSVFYTILGTTLFLVLIGLVMVLSASSVWSYLGNEGFYGRFAKQITFALMGIPIMLLMSRAPLYFWKTWAVRILVGGILLQLLVFTPMGVESGGNRNWIRLGGFNLQPSEFLKLGIALWLGVALPRSMAKSGGTWKVLAPIVMALISIGFVMLGGDLGTAIIMLLIILGCLIFSGIEWRYILAPVALAAAGGLVFAVASPNRVSRILTFLTNNCAADANASALSWCWQPLHGNWAMANGGLFGVGLGKSKAKWSWLPASDNDYIFAIIGEELGMIGCIVVLALFVVLAISFLKVIREATDPLIRIATGGILLWLIGQAFINVAVVLGIIPVLGVPLPFISSGGTALLAALFGIGVVLSFARHNELVARAR